MTRLDNNSKNLVKESPNSSLKNTEWHNDQHTVDPEMFART